MQFSNHHRKNCRSRSFLLTLPIWFLGISLTTTRPVGMVYVAMWTLQRNSSVNKTDGCLLQKLQDKQVTGNAVRILYRVHGPRVNTETKRWKKKKQKQEKVALWQTRREVSLMLCAPPLCAFQTHTTPFVLNNIHYNHCEMKLKEWGREEKKNKSQKEKTEGGDN